MAADFMAPRAPFRSNYLLLVIFLLTHCSVPGNDPTGTTWVNGEVSNLRRINGIMNLDNKPFNGSIFILYPGTKDTAETSGYLHGKEHGTWEKYYENGRLKEKRTFIEGQKTGEYIAL